MGDIGSGLVRAKRPGARRQDAPRSGKSAFSDLCFPFFAFSVCACVCCANQSAPDPDLEGSTEKNIHSHKKVAVDTATVAFRNARQSGHGARVQRPETPEERIPRVCVAPPKNRTLKVSSCRDSASGCRPRSFSNDDADAGVFSIGSFLYLLSPIQNIAPRHAQTTRDVLEPEEFRGGGCFARPFHDVSSCFFGRRRWMHLLPQHTTGQPSARLQGLQSSRNSALLAGDQSKPGRGLCSRVFRGHRLLQGTVLLTIVALGKAFDTRGSSPLFCFSIISVLKRHENQRLLCELHAHNTKHEDSFFFSFFFEHVEAVPATTQAVVLTYMHTYRYSHSECTS
jgi:hypothetical protein